MLFRAKHYLIYRLTSLGAHSLHSPFVFALYNEVIKKKKKGIIRQVEKLRGELKKEHQKIRLEDFKSGESKEVLTSNIAKTSLSHPKFSAFLHLLAAYLNADTVLETGSSLGINALYLSHAKCVKKVVTLEGSPIIAEIASNNFARFNDKKIELVVGSIYDTFINNITTHQAELIFLDADHRSSAIDFCLNNILINSTNTKCIVIHDIYWSKDMHRKWTEIVADKRFKLTIDLFQAGLVFPNIEIQKQHFKLKF